MTLHLFFFLQIQLFFQNISGQLKIKTNLSILIARFSPSLIFPNIFFVKEVRKRRYFVTWNNRKIVYFVASSLLEFMGIHRSQSLLWFVESEEALLI